MSDSYPKRDNIWLEIDQETNTRVYHEVVIVNILFRAPGDFINRLNPEKLIAEYLAKGFEIKGAGGFGAGGTINVIGELKHWEREMDLDHIARQPYTFQGFVILYQKRVESVSNGDPNINSNGDTKAVSNESLTGIFD